jgi:hypothetical protein
MTVDTYSEEHRHRCEVRWCIAKGFAWFQDYIAGVAKARRSAEPAKRIWDDVKQQAAAGNKGLAGEWIET